MDLRYDVKMLWMLMGQKKLKAGCCGYGNEPSVSIKGGEFLE
jgi:hypothetical protein